MHKLKKSIFKGIIYIVTLLSLYLYGLVEQNSFCGTDEKSRTNEKNQTSEEEVESFNNEDKKIAITFDDGPSEKWTTYLLDELKKRNVKATFFVVGKNAHNYTDLLVRMKNEGHLIGNHTYNHIEATGCCENVVKEEISMTNNLIKKVTKQETMYWRPCYGKYEKNHAIVDNMMIVMWDIDPYDWRTTDEDSIVENVIKNADDNKIILLHDIYESSVKAAIKIVDSLTVKGYKFVTVDEVLGM